MIASTDRMRQFGVSLIELMVAMVIGLFLILGAVTVFSQSRSTYRTAESVARLQEIGRLAMDVVETDVRMANFWGMSNARTTSTIARRSGGRPPAATQRHAAGEMPLSAAPSLAPSNYFVLNLDEYVGGSNNSYALTCAANNYLAGTDTLWIRRANATQPAALDSTRIYLQTSRIRGTLFVPACTAIPPTRAASRQTTCPPLPSPANSRHTSTTCRRARPTATTCRRSAASGSPTRAARREAPSSTRRSSRASKTCRCAWASTRTATRISTST